MEAWKIIRRIASYAVFVVAASLFMLNSVTVALAPYIDMVKAYDQSFMPFMYTVLSLGVMLLFQLLVIKKPREIEKNIYPWLLIVLFAAMLFVGAVVLGKAIVACSKDNALNVWYAVAGTVPTILVAATEVAVGIVLFVKERKEAAKPEPIESNGVNLEKEE